MRFVVGVLFLFLFWFLFGCHVGSVKSRESKRSAGSGCDDPQYLAVCVQVASPGPWPMGKSRSPGDFSPSSSMRNTVRSHLCLS